jgi:hypothetical protein
VPIGNQQARKLYAPTTPSPPKKNDLLGAAARESSSGAGL